jgi:hypothetical protein
MSKSVAFFTGVDSFCRPVSVAYRADGVAFARDYGRTKYGMAWSKWRKLEHPTPMYKAVKDGQVEWGFKTLRGGAGDAGWRLPSE